MALPTADPNGLSHDEVRAGALEMIRIELAAAEAEGRPNSWKAVQAAYPSLRHRSLHNWIALVKAGGTVADFADNNRIPEKKKAAIRISKEVGKHLPVAPPPNYIMRHPEHAPRALDFLAATTLLYNDGIMLRDYATTDVVDADGKVTGEKIKIPKYFSDSIERRIRVVETALKLHREVYELQRIQDFYGAIIQVITVEIGPMHPTIQKRIIDKLRDLNARYMMTPAANVI